MTGVSASKYFCLGVALGPALALLALATYAPRWAMFFAGGALAWLLATTLVWRGRSQISVRAAVRHLRRNEIAQAIAVMDALVRAEPGQAEHYRFRAELYRLSGHLDDAERDYQQVVHILPDRIDGYLGLAEVALQRGEYERALAHARQAAKGAPRDWRVAYSLALIADRLGDANAALEYAQAALGAGLNDRRFVLLLHLWRARSHARLGDLAAAQSAVQDLRSQRQGLREWQTVLASPQGACLRAMAGDDVRQAQALIEGKAIPALWTAQHEQTASTGVERSQEVGHG